MIQTHSSDTLLRRGLKLSHLRLLAALADEGQLTKAAATLGVSQPAASRLVAEIERILDAPIHERSGRGMGLTAMGRALALRSQRVRLELDDAARDLAEIAIGGAGRVRIGAVTGACFGPRAARAAGSAPGSPECHSRGRRRLVGPVVQPVAGGPPRFRRWPPPRRPARRTPGISGNGGRADCPDRAAGPSFAAACSPPDPRTGAGLRLDHARSRFDPDPRRHRPASVTRPAETPATNPDRVVHVDAGHPATFRRRRRRVALQRPAICHR